ncbi:hypothetical protein ACCO45_005776 [Purpureocillium lilacinum]|uniref:Uncharacterized protein n=1 Tax=Purpureocillium lilacinum TaxID=33203 RepID=A0ACC4DYQ2_PURLI
MLCASAVAGCWKQRIGGPGHDIDPWHGTSRHFFLDHFKVVKTFSNLLNSVHHPFAGARCSADSGGASDSIETQ